MDLDVLWNQFYQMKPMLDEQFAAWRQRKAEEAEADRVAAEAEEAEETARLGEIEASEEGARIERPRDGGAVLQRPT